MCYKGKKRISFAPLLKTKLPFKKTDKTNINHHTFKSTSDMVRLSTKSAIIKLLKTVIPATLSGIVIPVATMLDSFMIINLLTMSGYSEVVSTSLYGLWGGIVQSFISIPIILIAGLSTSLVPSLSGVVAGNDIGKISIRVRFFIKITWILSIFMFISIFVFAEDILRFLYGSGLRTDVIDELFYATKMLKISSVSIIYYAFLQTFTAIMQTMGRSSIPFWALLISLLLRTLLVFVLVKIVNVNIFGAIIANVLFLSLTCVILSIFIKKYTSADFYLFRHLFVPLIVGFLTLFLMTLLNFGLKLIIHYFLSMVISFLVGLALFFVSIWVFRVFDEREKREFFSRNRKITNDKKQ